MESLEKAVVESQDLLGVCENPKKKPQISPLRCAPVEMTILFEGGVPCFQEKYEILVATELSSRLPGRAVGPEEPWACGPPKVMKNAFCLRPLSHGSAALVFVISTEAKRSGEISVLTPLPGNVFRPERSVVEGSAVSFKVRIPFSLFKTIPCSTNVSRASLS